MLQMLQQLETVETDKSQWILSRNMLKISQFK